MKNRAVEVKKKFEICVDDINKCKRGHKMSGISCKAKNHIIKGKKDKQRMRESVCVCTVESAESEKKVYQKKKRTICILGVSPCKRFRNIKPSMNMPFD